MATPSVRWRLRGVLAVAPAHHGELQPRHQTTPLWLRQARRSLAVAWQKWATGPRPAAKHRRASAVAHHSTRVHQPVTPRQAVPHWDLVARARHRSLAGQGQRLVPGQRPLHRGRSSTSLVLAQADLQVYAHHSNGIASPYYQNWQHTIYDNALVI